jgi:hypothetical protein
LVMLHGSHIGQYRLASEKSPRGQTLSVSFCHESAFMTTEGALCLRQGRWRLNTARYTASVRFLQNCFQSTGWIALFLKNYQNGTVAQRIGPLSWAISDNVQAWLCDMNARRFNVYCGVNEILPGRRVRTRDAIGAIRHVFLDADRHATAVLTRIAERRDVPPPSYVLASSPGRFHIFWRVNGFDAMQVEGLQRQLARELGTDTAATPISQLTRLAGFYNHKRQPPSLVTVVYGDVDRVFTPDDFPAVPAATATDPVPVVGGLQQTRGTERARRYLERVPPATAGQHGDVQTFRVCCRIVRGFALEDDEALDVLQRWNARCQPPWSYTDLLEKVRRARKYGREPIGGLL